MDRLNRASAALLCSLAFWPIASTALAHHVSMSFSEWEFHDVGASLTYRVPLADALWLMDPDLVIKEETRIRLKRPVDEAIGRRLGDFLGSRLKEKVSVKGCGFDERVAVEIDGGSVQLHATLACESTYLDDFDLVNHFIVDENRLHTSLATLNFPDHVRQCLFRSSRHTCSVEAGGSGHGPTPAAQAVSAPWWDLIALLILFSATPLSIRARISSMAFLVLGHAFAPLTLLAGLSVPAPETVMPLLAFFPLYSAVPMYATSGGDMKKAAAWAAACHGLLLCLALAGLFRTGLLSIAGAAFFCTALFFSSFGGQDGADPSGAPPPDLRLLSFCFGLLYGFLLTPIPSGSPSVPGNGILLHALALLPVLFLLSTALDKLVFRFRGRGFALRLVLSAGTAVLLLRNSTLPFSSFNVEGARDLLLGFIQQQETRSSLPVAALLLSVILGGLHALTPGHGKTIVAAYLVGTKGRVSDAIVLGIIVTLTHTFIIILLALVALFASQTILPDQLMPWITCSSGLLILVLGLYLFLSRLRNSLRFGTATSLPDVHAHPGGEGSAAVHDHAHGDPHDHHHEHPREIRHSHDGIAHTHVLPSPDVRFWNLAALGVSGGIVPCPDALAVLLIAVSINRILLGISVILAFSVGLAAVLIAIGIVMVKARPLLDRVSGGGRLTTLWLPLASAAIVTLLGAALLWKSIPW